MRSVAVRGFAEWREAARALATAGVEPRAVSWSAAEDAQAGLLAAEPVAASARPFRVPRRFVEAAETAACHADGERWGVLYGVLWRIVHGEPRLMEVATDPAVHRLLRMERAVRHETHRVMAFVRFREVAEPEGTRHVAWIEPAHDVLERAAPFFAERFASLRWSILTPRRSAHWDGDGVRFGPGAERGDAPASDAAEALWRTYYASTFNPARLRERTLRAEMPPRLWRNLPEAAEIAPLVRGAAARVRRMLEGTSGEEELPRRARRDRSGR